MGFGLDLNIKVEVPKVDVAGAAKGAVDSATAAVSGAVASATSAVSGAVGAVTGAVSAASGAVAALSSVAGAIADVAVSFTGAIEDLVLEPHLQLSANASFGKTEFKKGPIWIRIDLPPAEARQSNGKLHLYSESKAYDQEKPIKQYADESEHTVACLFADAPMNESYSLEVIADSGDKKLVFSGVPYGHMRKSGQAFLDGIGPAAPEQTGDAQRRS